MSNPLFNSWNQISGKDRLEIVFQQRFKVYGAYAIRKQYNRNTVFAMIVAPVLFSFVLAAFLIKFNQSPPASTITFTPPPIIIHDFYRDLESEFLENPSNSSTSSNRDDVSFVPQIDNGAPEREFICNLKSNNRFGTSGEEEGDEYVGKTPPESTAHKEIAIIEKPSRPAEFIGGEAKFIEFIQNNYLPPASADELYADGYLKIRFVVSTTGLVSRLQVVESSIKLPEYINEVKRVLQNSPRWIPAMHNGKFVNSWHETQINIRE